VGDETASLTRPRHLFVVSRQHRPLYELFVARFQDDKNAEVILDRRVATRVPTAGERRRRSDDELGQRSYLIITRTDPSFAPQRLGQLSEILPLEAVPATRRPPFRLGYRPSLDGLRGVAILMVMAHHAGFGFAGGGFIGVELFFVLSGFLITSLLVQEHNDTGTVRLRNFYARRGLRLLPALAVLLSMVVTVPRLFLPPDVSPWPLAAIVLLYSANWMSAFRLVDLDVLGPTWSLAVEEQFYMLWPPVLVLFLALKVRRRWIVALLGFGIASASAIRAVLWDEFGRDAWTRLYYGLDTQMDSLLLGCLIGMLAAWDLLPRRGWSVSAMRYAALVAMGVLGVLLYAAPPRNSPEFFYGAELLVSVAGALLIVGLVTVPRGAVSSFFEIPGLVWVGRISYGLYLWHVPVFYGVLRNGRVMRLGLPLVVGPLRFASAFLVAAASFYVIEQPMLRLKGRFRSQTRSSVSSVRAGLRALNGHLRRMAR
jgi:peptidoglycan/LPS O-acetylase OafA/YrhL